MIAVRDGGDPNMIDDIRVQWPTPQPDPSPKKPTPPSNCSRPGLLPQSYALAKLGYSDDEIRTITSAPKITDTVAA